MAMATAMASGDGLRDWDARRENTPELGLCNRSEIALLASLAGGVEGTKARDG
jgi:hypothetical protein